MPHKSKKHRKKDPSFVPTDLQPTQILSHIANPVKQKFNYKGFFEDDDQYPFIKLLEIINMRAAGLSDGQSTFPRMDLTALYCLGVTIQEYIRYLNSDIVNQKRQLESKPPIDCLLSPEEIDQRSALALIEKYKTKPAIQPKHTSLQVIPRPNLEDDLNYVEKLKRSRTRYQVEVKTSNKETEQDKLAKNDEWKGALGAKRNSEAETIASKERRKEAEKERLIRKRKREERQEQLKRQKQLEENIPPPQSAAKKAKNESTDMFDLSSQKSTLKKRKTVSKKKSGF